MWLDPADDSAIAAKVAAFRLVARYLRPEPTPWRDTFDRIAGLKRAAVLLRGDAV